MALPLSAFPIATDYDRSEDPPGSVDPLGTLSDASTIADVLLHGFTARMYRPRLLTAGTVGAVVADRVVQAFDGREDVRQEARLTFERLFVSSIVLLRHREGEKGIARRVAGRQRARQALEAKLPLTPANFLKGQAVNGPAGVMARLAESLAILDDDGRLGSGGTGLLLSWSQDEGLPGVLDQADNGSAGAHWASAVARATVKWLRDREWPTRGSRLWADLGDHLRPDGMKRRERQTLTTYLNSDPIRCRMLELLRAKAALTVYRSVLDDARGLIERRVLIHGVKPQLGRRECDEVIRATLQAADAYEGIAAGFQEGFDTLRWVLTRQSGAAPPDRVLSHSVGRNHLARTMRELRFRTAALDRARAGLRFKETDQISEPLDRMRSDLNAALGSPMDFANTVVERHERVQKKKHKGIWIDRGPSWTLMPGFGLSDEEPPRYAGTYLHPFRVGNAYSFLTDLGKVAVTVRDEETE